MQLSSKKVIITVLFTLKTVIFHPKTVMATAVAASFYLACRFLATGFFGNLMMPLESEFPQRIGDPAFFL